MSDQSIGMMLLFGLGLPSCVVCNLLIWKMMSAVNRKLPRGEHFSPPWLYPRRLGDLERLHKELFPESRLRLYAIATTLVFVTAAGLGAYFVSQK